ncbi:hypothetical protein AAG906_023609 [Vitis piasezkii]
MPSFPGGLDPWGEPNVKEKKERKFTASFVGDQLLEVIGFRDAWHVDKFLPLNAHGTRLAQAQRIRFELCRGAAKQIYMSFDGIKWKQPTPIDDDTFPIEISYLGRTGMLVDSTSKCKLKASSIHLSMCMQNIESTENDSRRNSIHDHIKFTFKPNFGFFMHANPYIHRFID